MKKFLAAVLVAFVLVLTTNLGGASAATASAQVNTVASVSVIQAAPTAVAPKALGGGGIKPVWLYTSCYWAMNGARYCWRYGCSFYERVVLGCYDGWQRVTGWYA